MAVISKIRRVANPRRGGVSRTRRFAARLKRRKANPKMVRNRFGRFVKRAKVRRTIKRRTRARATNPVRRRRKTSVGTRYKRRTRKRNPLLVELGMVNPRRRSKSVAKRKYRRTKANPRRRRAVARVSRKRTYRRRRRVVANPAPRRRYRRRRAVASAPVRRYRRRRHTANPRRRRHHRHYARRMNPFGSSTKDMVTLAGGILVGVAATKYIPSLIPASMLPAGGSPYTGILITGGAAFAAGYLAHRFMPGQFANGVMAGGIALTLSQVLNVFAPSAVSRQLALSGMGDIVPGYYVVPQNPITNRAPVLQMPAAGGGGVGAFTGAFGGRR